MGPCSLRRAAKAWPAAVCCSSMGWEAGTAKSVRAVQAAVWCVWWGWLWVRVSSHAMTSNDPAPTILIKSASPPTNPITHNKTHPASSRRPPQSRGQRGQSCAAAAAAPPPTGTRARARPRVWGCPCPRGRWPFGGGRGWESARAGGGLLIVVCVCVVCCVRGM